VHEHLAAQAERADLGGRIAGVEAGQPAGVALAGQQGARKAPAELVRLRDLSDWQDSRGARVKCIGRHRKSAEHVDHDRDAPRLARAGHVIKHVNLHGGPLPYGSRRLSSPAG
jgi:hypothetical protein